MKLNIIILCATLFLLSNPCGAMSTKNPELSAYEKKISSLESVAHRYQEFLNQFGQKNPGDIMSKMKAIFAPNIKKFVNGDLVAETIEGLHKQISAAKSGIGNWNVREASEAVASPDKNMVIVHFDIPTEKKGTIVVMKKLICDDKGLIKVIDEVFNFKVK